MRPNDAALRKALIDILEAFRIGPGDYKEMVRDGTPMIAFDLQGKTWRFSYNSDTEDAKGTVRRLSNLLAQAGRIPVDLNRRPVDNRERLTLKPNGPPAPAAPVAVPESVDQIDEIETSENTMADEQPVVADEPVADEPVADEPAPIAQPPQGLLVYAPKPEYVPAHVYVIKAESEYIIEPGNYIVIPIYEPHLMKVLSEKEFHTLYAPATHERPYLQQQTAPPLRQVVAEVVEQAKRVATPEPVRVEPAATPEPVRVEPVATPEPVRAEPATTPEAVRAEPAATAKPVRAEPATTPEPVWPELFKVEHPVPIVTPEPTPRVEPAEPPPLSVPVRAERPTPTPPPQSARPSSEQLTPPPARPPPPVTAAPPEPTTPPAAKPAPTIRRQVTQHTPGATIIGGDQHVPAQLGRIMCGIRQAAIVYSRTEVSSGQAGQYMPLSDRKQIGARIHAAVDSGWIKLRKSASGYLYSVTPLGDRTIRAVASRSYSDVGLEVPPFVREIR
jgi:hypothetical protein